MQQINAVQVEAVWPMWTWLLVLTIAIIPIVFSSIDRCRSRGGFRLGSWLVALIITGGVLLFWGSQRHTAHVVAHAFSENADLAPSAIEAGEAKMAHDPSLDALWEKLTKSRIDLDGGSAEPIAAAADVKIRQKGSEMLDLDDNGQPSPQWVLHPPKRVGKVYRETVASEPFVSIEECRRQLELELLPQAVARRIESLASAKAGQVVRVPDALALGVGPEYILREICRDEFTGTVDFSVGEMKKVYVLLEFDKNIDSYLVDAWLRHERQHRFASVGKIAALSLTGLAAVYGLLRFDTWSKGYYSRQLLVGGSLAIIALVVLLLRAT